MRFDANKGTPMKEWFSLDPESELAWLPLAREALDFARAWRSAAFISPLSRPFKVTAWRVFSGTRCPGGGFPLSILSRRPHPGGAGYSCPCACWPGSRWW